MLRFLGILLVVGALFPTWNTFLPDVMAPTRPITISIPPLEPEKIFQSFTGKKSEPAPTRTARPDPPRHTRSGAPVYADGPCQMPPKGEWVAVTVSWYGNEDHGKPTATGQKFDQNKLSAAHTCLPFGTKVVFHDPDTRQEIVIPVTDRGPFDPERLPVSRKARLYARNLTPHPEREFDFSKAAARKFGFLTSGTKELYAWVF